MRLFQADLKSNDEATPVALEAVQWMAKISIHLLLAGNLHPEADDLLNFLRSVAKECDVVEFKVI